MEIYGNRHNQRPDQTIDVSDWKMDEEFGVYPEGARDETLYYCPSPNPHRFLISGHRHLLKQAFKRYPDRFWTEIIAYRIGRMLEINVPPTFMAYDRKTEICGALIEWFLGYKNKIYERYVPGGDIMQNLITNFYRKEVPNTISN